MATDLETKPATPKFEVFVDQELAKVRHRIRSLDALRSLMMLAVVTLSYLLLMASFDLAVKGADRPLYTGLRWGAFVIYALAMVFFTLQLGMRLYRRINPYYAAKQLEETLPDAKNSVINWLDLKEQPLPGAIRNAVGLKAARDLKETDPEKVVNPKSNWLLGGILAGLVLGLLVLFALGPNQFRSLLERAFPFLGIRLENRTHITLLQPPEGNVTVALNQRVDFLAHINGRYPRGNQLGAPSLFYRYQAADSFVAIPLDELDNNWGTTLQPDQVQNGLWYKIAAGDKETEVFQVKVQSLPLATRFDVTYHFRPYRKMADQSVTFPDKDSVVPRIRGHRGTEVILVVRTNRILREGRIEVDAAGVKNEHFGEIQAQDAQSFRVKLTLERGGTFRVFFTSMDGEGNSDSGNAYGIEVLDDETPRVVLTKPGMDVALPANAALQVEGSANDDFGIKNLTLRLKILEGAGKPALAQKVYREGTSFKFEDGTYPDKIDYLDIVPLETLKTAQGEAFPLKTGMILEYWLEATDNADYPTKDGNVGRSQAYKVTILDPSADPKQKEDRKKAEEQKQQHEKKQDQKQSEENQKRQEERKSAEEKRKEQEEQKNELDRLRKEVEEKNKQIQDQIKQEDKDNKKGDVKPDDQPKSDKSKAEQKPGDGADKNKADKKDQKPGDQNQAGDKKDDGKNGQGQDAAKAKDQGPKDKGKDDPNNPAEAKGPGNEKKPDAGAKGNDPKNDQQNPKNNQDGKAQAKDGPKDQQPTQAKEKDQGNNKEIPTGECKECDKGKGPGPGQGNNPATAKGNEPGNDKASPKEGNQGGTNPKEAAQPSAKNGGDKGPQGAGNPKDANPEQAKDSGQAKDELGKPAAPQREPTAEEMANLEKKLKRNEQAEEAFEELSRLAKEAKDPKVREAAKKLLDEFAKEQPVPPKDKGSKQPDDKAQGNTKDPGDMGQTADKGQTKKGEPPQVDGAAKGDTGEDAEKAQAKGGSRFGNKTSGNSAGDDPKASNPDAAAQKRAADLQLEELKNRVTPETLKKSGITDAQWQQFLKDAQRYNELLQKTQAAKKATEKGATSQLPSTGPRTVNTNPDVNPDPLLSNRFQPPPEFRDAQRQFTSRPDPGKK